MPNEANTPYTNTMNDTMMLLRVIIKNMEISLFDEYTRVGFPFLIFSNVMFTYASPMISRTNVSSYTTDTAPIMPANTKMTNA